MEGEQLNFPVCVAINWDDLPSSIFF